MVMDSLCQVGVVCQNIVMPQYLRQLTISKYSKFVEISKSPPTLTAKGAMQISDTYLSAFEETYLAAAVKSNIPEGREILHEQQRQLDCIAPRMLNRVRKLTIVALQQNPPYFMNML